MFFHILALQILDMIEPFTVELHLFVLVSLPLIDHLAFHCTLYLFDDIIGLETSLLLRFTDAHQLSYEFIGQNCMLRYFQFF